MTTRFIIEPALALRSVAAYNRGRYRGRLNVTIDRDGYERFRHGLSRDTSALVEQLRFVGDDYGGAQVRFIPHSIGEEAALIARRLAPDLGEFSTLVKGLRMLSEAVPRQADLAHLFAPFVATKRWGVWASKTLHFLRPATFPVLDSRAKKALGVASLGSSAVDYHRFCLLLQEALSENLEVLAAARTVDDDASPSDLKLLDKILYEAGG
jgi:pimeloyl-ACP methyl ester carboxylesterase